MKPGDLVQIRIPNGWSLPRDMVGIEDGQVGLLVKINPIEYPTAGHKLHNYTVLINGKTHIFKRRFLDRVYG